MIVAMVIFTVYYRFFIFKVFCIIALSKKKKLLDIKDALIEKFAG